MLASGFTNAPVTKSLVYYVVASALLVAFTDTKYYLPVAVVPHLWVYRQFWRLLTWQAAYTNSTEVLFAAMTLYHMRVVERLWGSRKFASFLITVLPYTTFIPPVLIAVVLRPLTFNHLNYLPAGPTALVFAILSQYHASIPITYKYRLATSAAASSSAGATVLTLTSKTITYVLPAQIALSQLPGSVVPALVGWAVGYAWRNDLLPVPSDWRVPGWLVGVKDSGRHGEGFEGLRRRLETEQAAATGTEGRTGREGRRRTFGAMVADQFRGTG